MRVSMLGGFTVSYKGRKIVNDRANKSALLLGYFIYHRARRITRKELCSLLWEDPEQIEDPDNSLKVTIHRARALLKGLDAAAGKGILHADGESKDFLWNPAIRVVLDTEEFTALVKQAAVAPDDAQRLELLLQASALYQGELLPNYSAERWVMPLSAYYHNQYIEAVETALALLKQKRDTDRIIALCNEALRSEPYSERLYHYKLRALIDSGNPQQAWIQYENLRNRYFEVYGVPLSKELHELGHEAGNHINNQVLTSDHLRKQMQEMSVAFGALICDYDVFCLLYQAYARNINRTGETVYIGLMTLQSTDRKMPSRKVLDHAADNLLAQISKTLRKGDAVTRCSASQVMVMLPMASQENSQRICERICSAFQHALPRSHLNVTYTLQPISAVDE